MHTKEPSRNHWERVTLSQPRTSTHVVDLDIRPTDLVVLVLRLGQHLQDVDIASRADCCGTLRVQQRVALRRPALAPRPVVLLGIQCDLHKAVHQLPDPGALVLVVKPDPEDAP